MGMMSEDAPTGLLVLGAGGHARVVADAAAAVGFINIVFLDRAGPKSEPIPRHLDGHSIEISTLEAARRRWPSHALIVGIGDNSLRLALQREAEELGFSIATIIHPHSWVSPHTEIARGVVIMAGAVVQTATKLGRAVIVNTGASIDHESQIADGAHICPGAHLAGNVSLGLRSFVGTGAMVRHNIVIGDDVTIGVGAAVVGNISEAGQYIGVPARKLG